MLVRKNHNILLYTCGACGKWRQRLLSGVTEGLDALLIGSWRGVPRIAQPVLAVRPCTSVRRRRL